MVLECDNNVSYLYDSHFSLCCDILTDSGIKLAPNLLLELHAVFFVVSDFTAFAANHNRKAVSDEVLNTAFKKLASIYRPLPTQEFRKRINFYSSVVSGLELHAHALMGQDVSDAHPVLRCAIAFADCCLNPTYIHSYTSPAPVLSALDVFEFSTDVMEPLYHVFISYCNALYDCPVPALSESAKISSVPSPVKNSPSALHVAPVREAKKNKPISTLILILLSTIAIIIIAQVSSTKASPNPSTISPTQIATKPTESFVKLPTPVNGSIMRSTSRKRVAPLSIETTDSYNYYFILTEHGTTKIVMGFFARANSTVDIQVPLGNFDIYYAAGDTWYGTEHLFGSSTYRAKLDSVFAFTEGIDGYSGWTVQLQPVMNGNLDSDPVDSEDFPN